MGTSDLIRTHPVLSLFGALLLLVLAGGAIFVATYSGKGSVSIEKLPREAEVRSPSGPAVTMNAVRPRASGTSGRATDPRSEALARLRQDYETSTNLAEFIRSALASGALGSKFYAVRAFDRCGFVAGQGESLRASFEKQNTAPGSASAVARRRLDSEADRCRDVLLHYPDFVTAIRLQRGQTELRPDPLFVDMVRQETQDLLHEKLSLAWNLGDPNALAIIGQRLAPPTAGIDGRTLNEDEVTAYFRAWDVIACNLGADCSLMEILACAEHEKNCGAPIEQALKRAYGEKNFALVQKYRDVIISNLNSGDLTKFR